jgi:hypothetical protein
LQKLGLCLTCLAREISENAKKNSEPVLLEMDKSDKPNHQQRKMDG